MSVASAYPSAIAKRVPMLSRAHKKLILLSVLVVLSPTGAVLVRSSNGVALKAARPFGHAPTIDLPRIVLWAWERRENLTSIKRRDYGVAFLAGTLRLREGKVVVKPRLQPLVVPARTLLIAVVRIESDRLRLPSLSSQQAAESVAAIIRLTQQPATTAVQIDFDARTSERAFYRELLVRLRRELPASQPLSITALASWCLHDPWISDLPIDEAVPMLFRMGREGAPVFSRIEAGEDFRLAVCRQSYGISTDEPPPRLPWARRLYIFHPRRWSQDALEHILRKLEPPS